MVLEKHPDEQSQEEEEEQHDPFEGQDESGESDEEAALDRKIQELEKKETLRRKRDHLRRLKAGVVNDVAVGSGALPPSLPSTGGQQLGQPVVRSKTIKPKDWPKYTAKMNFMTHKDWVSFANNQHLSAPEYFRTEVDKILFAEDSLEGVPRTRWLEYKETHGTGDMTRSAFCDFLLNVSTDPETYSLEAGAKWLAARQERGQNARSFHNHLAGLEAQLPEQTEYWKAMSFLLRLRPELQKLVRQQGHPIGGMDRDA